MLVSVLWNRMNVKYNMHDVIIIFSYNDIMYCNET